jgi:hypothetical protein
MAERCGARSARRVVVSDTVPMSPAWLSADSVYVLHCNGFGVAPLP